MSKTTEEQRIESAVKLLAACHTRTLTQPAIDRWVRKLAPFGAKTALYRVLEDACDRTKMPACSEIVSETIEEISRERARNEDAWDKNPAKPLTGEERAKADAAMVKSVLWLMYFKGWSMTDVTARLGTLLGADPVEVLTAAQKQNTPETIQRWMENREEMR